jgi:fluoride exporter
LDVVAVVLWVGAGGFLGVNARYLLGGWNATRYGTLFPLGTFVINITGSFRLGFFLTLAQERLIISPNARLFFAVGFVGAYTTFSTFEYESMLLLQDRELVLALFNVLDSVLSGGVAVLGGIILASLI